MYSTVLYILKKDDTESGDIEVTYIENIHPKIISKVLPQILFNSKKYDIVSQEENTRKYLSELIPKKTNLLLLQNILKNYIRSITEIKVDLVNNFNKSGFEKIKIVDDRAEVKEIIMQFFKKDYQQLVTKVKKDDYQQLVKQSGGKKITYNSFTCNIADIVLNIKN